MITVERYTPEQKALWDVIVDQSRNATFLLRRDFMDYHADRFEDYSLIARDSDGKAITALPACRRGDTLVSHGGLTYGGWLLPSRLDTPTLLEVVDTAHALLAEQGFRRLVYKPVPHIYHRYPAEEDLYVLFRRGARQTQANLSAAIDLTQPLPFDRGNRHNLNVAGRSGVTVAPSDDWAAYWNILGAVLLERHGLSPVHTLDEIQLLHSRFPENISLWGAFVEDRMVAGTVLFDSDMVTHAQYIASSDEGRRTKALPALFHTVIAHAQNAGKRYFDFGVSTEDGGAYLNKGLMSQKSRLGGRAVVYPTLELDL